MIMKNISYLFIACLILLSACHNKSRLQLFNGKAALPPHFKFDALGLKVMSSFINTKSGTMSILYANEPALDSAINSSSSPAAGELLALVTWKQQGDEHWFGAKIPGDLQTVEVVEMSTAGKGVAINYKKYEGRELTASRDTVHQQDRINYIIDQRPSITP
jgi:hypothetical protein